MAFSMALATRSGPAATSLPTRPEYALWTCFVSASLNSAYGGPYAEFNEALTKQVQSAYSGLVGKLVAAGPDRVARAIEKAISVERPRARYVVTPTARMMIE